LPLTVLGGVSLTSLPEKTDHLDRGNKHNNPKQCAKQIPASVELYRFDDDRQRGSEHHSGDQ
jgi:hypothetical protein